MKALEAFLAPTKPLTGSAIFTPDSQENLDDTSGHLSQPTPDCSPVGSDTPPSNVSGPSPMKSQDDPLQAFKFIVSHLGEVDESTSARIRSGELTIRSILQAGLMTLNSEPTDPSTQASDKEKKQPCPALRTDRLLVSKNSRMVHSHSLPSVYTNQLRFKQFSTVAAIRINADLFGLTYEELIDPASESPFYKDAISKEGTKSISSKLLDSMPHLKPVDLQYQRSHHAYVDLIPCPIFRQRFIQLTTMEPPMIDKHEFCIDLENDGLICWGSFIGDTEEVCGSGAPWDIRSWEAQPWFLKKWWSVLGGQEGGLFQQSKWWHEIRGDEFPCFW